MPCTTALLGTPNLPDCKSNFCVETGTPGEHAAHNRTLIRATSRFHAEPRTACAWKCNGRFLYPNPVRVTRGIVPRAIPCKIQDVLQSRVMDWPAINKGSAWSCVFDSPDHQAAKFSSGHLSDTGFSAFLSEHCTGIGCRHKLLPLSHPKLHIIVMSAPPGLERIANCSGGNLRRLFNSSIECLNCRTAFGRNQTEGECCGDDQRFHQRHIRFLFRFHMLIDLNYSEDGVDFWLRPKVHLSGTAN
jgi:hypothetical protein